LPAEFCLLNVRLIWWALLYNSACKGHGAAFILPEVSGGDCRAPSYRPPGHLCE
jgi:hypothetical protein